MIGVIAPYIFTQLGATGNYSAIGILHTLQLTVTHALEFSVFTSRFLETDLSQSHSHFKSHMNSSCSYSATANSEDSTSFNSQLISWQAGVPKLDYSTAVIYSITHTSFRQSQSHVATDGRSVSQSVSLGVEPHLGPMTRSLLLFDSYGLIFSGAPSLMRGRVCLFYILLALSSAVSLDS
jgi:hypothetical protein